MKRILCILLGLCQPVIHRFAHFRELALIFQTKVVDFFLLVPGGQKNLALHAFKQRGLSLAHLGQGGHQGLVGFIKGFCRFVVLGVQLIQKTVSQVYKAMLLTDPVAFLLMMPGRLANQQNNQENDTQDQQQGDDQFIIHNS